MKKILVLVLALALSGCGLLSNSTAPAVVSAVDAVARLVQERVGKELGDVPVVCETESIPSEGKLLLLCTVCYDAQPGEVCR